MRDWSRSDKLTGIAIVVAIITGLATFAALWGPIFAPEPAPAPGAVAAVDGRGMFRMPPVVWRESHPFGGGSSAMVAYTPDGEVVGFGGLLDEGMKTDGACGGGREVVTIRDVDFIPETNIPYGFIGETVEGDRVVFALDSTLPNRLSRVEASWIDHVVREKRRAVVTYVMCGTAMVGDIDEIVAE